MSVHYTTNLDQFTFHRQNRSVNRGAVLRLAESIKRVGLKVPITVNRNGVILDGQHRVEAIREINKTASAPVRLSYIEKNMSIADIAEMNANQTAWRLSDWIHYYATGGNENYIKLKEAARKFTPHKMTSICALLSPNEGAHTKTVSAGRYVYDMTPEKEQILKKLIQYGKMNPSFTSKAVLLAIIDMRRLEGFRLQRLFDALDLHFESILTQSGKDNWARHFVRFYNKSLRTGRLNADDLPKSH
jgi:hypothetical protein